MNDETILAISISIAFFLTIFNFTTIGIALIDRKIRRRTSSYPVISFLLASTFQGMFAAPIYAYKHMEHDNHITGWVCDLSRLSYNLCHHLVKLSIVVISFDRVISIKFPYKYDNFVSKRYMLMLLVACWIVTFVVDMMPFIHDEDDEVCHYVPNKEWLLFIIIGYNIAPFVIIAMNYIFIWATAAKLAFSDRKQKMSVSRSLRKLSQTISLDLLERTQSSSCKKMRNSYIEKSKVRFMLELKATKTSLALIGVYVFCWGPIGMYMMIDTFCDRCLSLTDHASKDINVALQYLCFSSNLLAPLCYCWASKDYRKASRGIWQRTRLSRSKKVSSVAKRDW